LAIKRMGTLLSLVISIATSIRSRILFMPMIVHGTQSGADFQPPGSMSEDSMDESYMSESDPRQLCRQKRAGGGACLSAHACRICSRSPAPGGLLVSVRREFHMCAASPAPSPARRCRLDRIVFYPEHPPSPATPPTKVWSLPCKLQATRLRRVARSPLAGALKR
jgi:hypothetical protein